MYIFYNLCFDVNCFVMVGYLCNVMKYVCYVIKNEYMVLYGVMFCYDIWISIFLYIEFKIFWSKILIKLNVY